MQIAVRFEAASGLSAASQQQLALQATTDSDVEHLYWFANDRFIAKSRRDEAYFWDSAPGEYTILAVDDLGRAHSRKLTVTVAR